MAQTNDLFYFITVALTNALRCNFRGFIDGHGNKIEVPNYSAHYVYAAKKVNEYQRTHGQIPYEYYIETDSGFLNFFDGKDSDRDSICDFIRMGAIYISNKGGCTYGISTK